METALEFFAIFGGLNRKINTDAPINELIEKLILNEYKYLRNDVSKLTSAEDKYHSILTGIAMGDRRTNSAFKRAKLSFDDGIECVDKLCEMGVLKLETSYGNDNGPEKALFTTPFMRFWFAFISPIYKGIKEGNYDEFFQRYNNRKAEFTNLVFEQLSHEYLKEIMQEDKIYNLKRYWDDKNEIDLIAKTKSGKLIAGVCKYTNNKVKKSELTKLEATCKEASIKADFYVIFSKKGFSNELKALKAEGIKLFTCRNFKSLIMDEVL
jgi:AAA+ ATPase superfamily predicted ATPase